jgi:hypothetical protein
VPAVHRPRLDHRDSAAEHYAAPYDLLSVALAVALARTRAIVTPLPRSGCFGRGTLTVEKRIQWGDLPSPLTAAIEKRTGPTRAGRAVTAGQNSPLAAVVDTRDGRVFVKGLPSGHRLVVTQARETTAARLAKGISADLLWQFDEAGTSGPHRRS